MANSVRIEVATQEHADALAPVLRAPDLAELQAADGFTAEEALRVGLASGPCWAMVFGEEVGAMFGVCPLPADGFVVQLPDIGTAWLLTGEPVNRNRKAFFQACVEQLPTLLAIYPVLTNFVDARNEAALRWAKRLGFAVHPAEPYGVERLPFHQIALRREPCAPP